MKLLAAVILCSALGACATQPVAPPAGIFHDEQFAAPTESVGAEQVFALSDDMRHYLDVDIAHVLHTVGVPRGLIDALYRRDRLRLDYDASRTRNAAEAFAARKGNCLSLVIMTAAFAKELGVNVSYQAVSDFDTWSRSQDLVVLSRHVNVSFAKRPSTNFVRSLDPDRTMTVDFLPGTDLGRQRTHTISEETIVAMYMNNRAAEALADRRTDDAYWWARAAILQAPEYPTAYNTLGVVYLRHGDLASAEHVLRAMLARDPQDTKVMSNLAVVLERRGQGEESRALRERLAQLEPDPPYHYFWLGMAAMERGDYRSARDWFEREVERADYNSEFHFWLGVAELHLGYSVEARRQIAIAVDNSTTHGDFQLYSAKLEHLKALERESAIR